MQHARPPCWSPTPGVHSDSHPLSQWCHTAISSSIVHPLLLLPPISASIRVFSNESTLLMRWPKCWSFSFSLIPSKEHAGMISFKRTGWSSLQSKGLSRVFSNTKVQKHQFFCAQLFFVVQLSHPDITTGKTITLTRQTSVSKVMSLLLMQSKLAITFFTRSKRHLISWLQSPPVVILEPPKIKSDTGFPLFPHLFAMKWWDCMPWS